jgi:hypothetical protein
MTFCFVVPYRQRLHHLTEFVPHMQRRFRNAPIYIIEQGDDKPFNRGQLLNIGFVEYGIDFDYVALHDIDMLPTKADYSYPEVPTHLATKVQQFRYKMPAPDYFGGVVLFNNKDFVTCNGYSNKFEGWGGEDNQLYFELQRLKIPIARRECFFQSLYHKPANPNGYDAAKMEQAKKPRDPDDGLTHCKYEVVAREELGGYTKLKVLL